MERLSFLNTAWKEIPNTTICTFPQCNFLSEVNEFFYDKLSKNLAMMEKKLKPSKTFIIQQIGSIGFVSILCIKNLPNNSNHLTQYVNYVVSKFTLFSLYWKPSKRENLLTA